MADSDHVLVTLILQNSGVARQGFGKPLILSHTADWAERTRTYSSYAGVLGDFDADEPEAIAARQMFAQSPHPESIGIGRCAGAVTQRYDINVETVLNSTDYKIKVSGTGFDDETVSITSGGSADADAIIAALVTELNDVDDKNYTAAAVVDASGADMLRVTGNAPGDWFSLEIVNLDLLNIAQTHADANVDDDLAAILLTDTSWYWVVTLFNSTAYVETVAAWVEANGRAYIPELVESAAITTAYDEETSTDALADLAPLGDRRTLPFYHHIPKQMLGAALTGLLAPLKPGSWTAKFKSLTGVTPSPLNTNQRSNLVARRGNGYMVEMGRPITFEGTVGNLDFGFLDVTVGLDAAIDDLRKAIFGVEVSNNKVEATDEGIAKFEAAARGTLKRYSSPERPVFRDNDALQVIVPTLADFDANTRSLSNFRVQGELANAVHRVLIDLTVTNN